MAQLIKTVGGLAIASVKTINGLAVASVKEIGGVDNTAAAGAEITDDFSTTDTWTTLFGTFSVADNKGEGAAWNITGARHNTALSSANHYAQAVCSHNVNAGDGGGVIVRCDGTNYYRTQFRSDGLRIIRSDLGWAVDNTDTYSLADHTIKVEVTTGGSSVDFSIYVDGALDFTASDSSAGRYTSGSYAGVFIDRDSAGGTAQYVSSFGASPL